MDYLLHTMMAATNSSPDNGGGNDLLLLFAREGKFRAKTPHHEGKRVGGEGNRAGVQGYTRGCGA